MAHEKSLFFLPIRGNSMISVPALQTFHENLHTLSSELHTHLQSSDHPAVEKQVELSIHALEHLIFTHHFTPVQEKTLLKMDMIANLAHVTRQAYAYYEKDVEQTHAQSLLSLDKPEWVMGHSLLRRKYNLSVREGHLANLRPMERMVMIGSGHYPVNAIVFAKKFGTRTFIHETNEDARKNAERTIEKSNLGSRISFVEPKKIIESIQTADVVWMSGSVTDKRKWIEELAQVSRPGTRVICRTAHGLRTLMYEHAPLNNLPEFTKIGMIHPRKMEIESSALLIR